MARPTVKLRAKATNKQKQGWLANSASKQAKNWAHHGSRNEPPLINWELDGSFIFFAGFLSS